MCVCVSAAVRQKVSEESGARVRAESRVVEVEKQCSMLEFDLKQSVQKMEQLMKQKERLEDEVRDPPPARASVPGPFWSQCYEVAFWNACDFAIWHISTRFKPSLLLCIVRSNNNNNEVKRVYPKRCTEVDSTPSTAGK